ncbi:MAG: hypothetical protein V5A85_11165 [Haloarculaceae archaeon]
MRRSHVPVVLAVVLLVLVGVAAGTPVGSPTVEVSLPSNKVTAGEETTLDVQVANDAELFVASTRNPGLNELVTTADGVRLELRSGGSPVTVRTRERALGSLPDGATRTAGFEVSVAEGANPGRYSVPYELTYTYVRSVSEGDGAVDERTVTTEGYLDVRVEARARLAVVNASTDVRVGGSGTVSVTVENVGSAPVRDGRLSLRSPNADLAVGGGAEASRFLGRLAPGERRTVTYGVTASEGARPVEYAAEVVGTFEDDLGRRVTSDPLAVGLTPGVGRRFVVLSSRSDAVVGGTGPVTVRLRNAGEETVTDAAVSLRSTTPALGIDGGAAASRYVGRWRPGEVRSVTFDVAANVTAAPRRYALEGSVEFDSPEGVRSRVAPLPVAVPVRPELAFGLSDVRADLRVGREGVLRGTVRNLGNRTARNAVVVVESASPSVRFAESTYPVGDLRPGANATVAFDARVPVSAEPGPRAVTLRVRYEDGEGDPAESDGLDVRTSVGPEPELVELEPVDATFRADTSNRLIVEVTNVAGEPLGDVEARLAPGPPFTSEAPTSFVGELGPGETARLAFELTVSEDAVQSTHAVVVNVTAETADDETVRTGPTLLPVSVAAEPAGTGQVGTLVAGFVLVVVLLGAGYWWLRR